MRAEHASPSPLSHFDSADLLDALATGIVVLDRQLCVVYANVAAQDLLGAGFARARGRPFVDLLADSNGLDAVLRRALERSEAFADRELVFRPTGTVREPRVVDLTVTPLEGTVTGSHLLLELADATQRQRISREADLLARLDGSRLMIRQLAHEIRNPLGGLRGAAQLLERELADAAQREYTGVIIREADRLTALVDSMSGSARPPQKARTNVHELCEHVYMLLRSEARSAVLLERDYDPSLPDADLDRNQVIQALLNLGRNALQAIGDRGRVVLRSRALSGVTIGAVRHRLVVALQVEDNGPGVPDELRGSLFLPLVTGRANGTGLGLAVAQEIATRHGGIVEFESAPGRTVFTMLLPIVEPA
ncbi:MAG: PAS domain-containing protein [Steroidobacteraceae bacterium]|jgi:two-component system nitrogen regulation sensor histidine kinase GlnL|nr:PAS domain-containing protein [Steroidobacteraceae bacterium]